MNTSAIQYSADYVRDTSDTESFTDNDEPVEYEPFSEPENEPPGGILGDSSGQSDNDIITTKVVEVSVGDDGDLEFADSEQTASDGRSDSELELCDYGRCALCGGRNTTPRYRYCQGCFKVRKNLFPPRPKRKHKRKLDKTQSLRPLSQDSGIDSQELHEPGQSSSGYAQPVVQSDSGCSQPVQSDSGCSQPVQSEVRLSRTLHNPLKRRRAESADRSHKRQRLSYSDSESDSDDESKNVQVTPLVKTVSDPSLTIEEVKITKKVICNKLKEKIEKDNEENNVCIVCLSEPKSGVFVHGRIAHICCCYKCAVKVWAKAKRCPVCNCKVSNVLKAVVM